MENFRKKLRVYSLYQVIFSVFILLNACIGYSSAPFYTPETTCSIFTPDAPCLAIETEANALYSTELAFSIVLVVNGCLAITLSDNLDNRCLLKLVSFYSKIGLIAYPGLFIARFVLYSNVIKKAKPEMTEPF
jgi:hypothetical protein